MSHNNNIMLKNDMSHQREFFPIKNTVPVHCCNYIYIYIYIYIYLTSTRGIIRQASA